MYISWGNKLYFTLIKQYLEFNFFFSSATSQIVYGGDVKGESAMRFFEDIGQKIVHTYIVRNSGPWHVEGLTVTIDWPLQVASYSKQGKWLLYLEGIPEFDNSK